MLIDVKERQALDLPAAAARRLPTRAFRGLYTIDAGERREILERMMPR
jgi:hypothetical protein